MYYVYRGVLYCYVSIEIDDVFVSDECKDSFTEFTKQKSLSGLGRIPKRTSKHCM